MFFRLRLLWHAWKAIRDVCGGAYWQAGFEATRGSGTYKFKLEVEYPEANLDKFRNEHKAHNGD